MKEAEVVVEGFVVTEAGLELRCRIDETVYQTLVIVADEIRSDGTVFSRSVLLDIAREMNRTLVTRTFRVLLTGGWQEVSGRAVTYDPDVWVHRWTHLSRVSWLAFHLLEKIA